MGEKVGSSRVRQRSVLVEAFGSWQVEVVRDQWHEVQRDE